MSATRFQRDPTPGVAGGDCGDAGGASACRRCCLSGECCRMDGSRFPLKLN
jgi:hypothetical protein